ncbi:hypothetical protein A0H81_07925 [Grifola frondosa]|uniref:Uncharacterized protein n=1 Tax=Grifola frondosa TaxID=5627 RepID=A0A1C7M7S9_GRIFR|nr:hypothetical protein A0H81_07925 [Grifola frondosa]
MQGKNGKMYWLIVFSIEIHFGLTEFRARIKWTDNGRVKYGPASIVYNESGHRAEEDEPDGTPDDSVTVVSSQSDRHPSQPRPALLPGTPCPLKARFTPRTLRLVYPPTLSPAVSKSSAARGQHRFTAPCAPRSIKASSAK